MILRACPVYSTLIKEFALLIMSLHGLSRPVGSPRSRIDRQSKGNCHHHYSMMLFSAILAAILALSAAQNGTSKDPICSCTNVQINNVDIIKGCPIATLLSCPIPQHGLAWSSICLASLELSGIPGEIAG